MRISLPNIVISHYKFDTPLRRYAVTPLRPFHQHQPRRHLPQPIPHSHVTRRVAEHQRPRHSSSSSTACLQSSAPIRAAISGCREAEGQRLQHSTESLEPGERHDPFPVAPLTERQPGIARRLHAQSCLRNAAGTVPSPVSSVGYDWNASCTFPRARTAAMLSVRHEAEGAGRVHHHRRREWPGTRGAELDAVRDHPSPRSVAGELPRVEREHRVVIRHVDRPLPGAIEPVRGVYAIRTATDPGSKRARITRTLHASPSPESRSSPHCTPDCPGCHSIAWSSMGSPACHCAGARSACHHSRQPPAVRTARKGSPGRHRARRAGGRRERRRSDCVAPEFVSCS